MTYDEIIKRLEKMLIFHPHYLHSMSAKEESDFMAKKIHKLIEDLKAAKDNLVEVKVSAEEANKWLEDFIEVKVIAHNDRKTNLGG